MATYGCLLIFFGMKNTIYENLTPLGKKWRITLWVFVFTFLLPAMSIYIAYVLRLIPSLLLSKPSDRTYPYIITFLFYLGLFYMMMDLSIWNVIKLFVAGGGLAILLTAIINLRYKISAHMVGLGGFLGALISMSFLIQFDLTFFYIAVILIAGITATARLILREHKPPQLYLGFALGLGVQTFMFYLLQKLTLI